MKLNIALICLTILSKNLIARSTQEVICYGHEVETVGESYENQVTYYLNIQKFAVQLGEAKIYYSKNHSSPQKQSFVSLWVKSLEEAYMESTFNLTKAMKKRGSYPDHEDEIIQHLNTYSIKLKKRLERSNASYRLSKDFTKYSHLGSGHTYERESKENNFTRKELHIMCALEQEQIPFHQSYEAMLKAGKGAKWEIDRFISASDF